MAGFLYYIPNEKGCSARVIERCGLAYALPADGKGITARGCSGPDGGSGVCCALVSEGMEEQVGYYADRQIWRKAPERPYWVGSVKDSPPTPADIQRVEIVNGHTVTLDDGHDWIVPLVRAFNGATALPMTIGLGDDGDLMFRPKAMYAAITADADKVFQQLRRDSGDDGAGGEPLTLGDLWRITCAALAINYRIGPIELDLLSLIDTTSVNKVAAAMIDLPTIIEVGRAQVESQKKSSDAHTPAGCSIGDGEKGSPSDTSRPTQTSGGTQTTTDVPANK